MKILDKYILRKFLTTFLFVVGVLMIVLVVIDYTEKNEDFINNKPPLAAIIFDYYLNFIPYYANLLSPITIFIATVFVTSQLSARTEIVAILSAGISFNRLLVPYIVGSLIVGVFTYIAVSYIIPNANKGRIAFELKYIKNPYTFDKRNIHFKVAPETYVSLESYNNAINTGYQFTIESIRGTELLSKLSADRVVWVDTTKSWRLEGIRLRKFFKVSDTAAMAGGVRNGLGYEDIKFIGQMDTILNMAPKDFESNYQRNETMTTPELETFIKNEQLRGVESLAPYFVERYLRLTYPFAILILTMIGVILSSRKSREGPGFQIAVGFILAFIYIMFFVMSRSIALTGNIDPLLACWLPNIVFSIIGLVLYKTVPR
jgi:lipopolysaccharide export system permease protein